MHAAGGQDATEQQAAQPDVHGLHQVRPDVPAQRVPQQPELDPPPAGTPGPRGDQHERQHKADNRQQDEAVPLREVEVREHHQPEQGEDKTGPRDGDRATPRRIARRIARRLRQRERQRDHHRGQHHAQGPGQIDVPQPEHHERGDHHGGQHEVPHRDDDRPTRLAKSNRMTKNGHEMLPESSQEGIGPVRRSGCAGKRGVLIDADARRPEHTTGILERAGIRQGTSGSGPAGCTAASASVQTLFFGNGDNSSIAICRSSSRGSGRANTPATRSSHLLRPDIDLPSDLLLRHIVKDHTSGNPAPSRQVRHPQLQYLGEDSASVHSPIRPATTAGQRGTDELAGVPLSDPLLAQPLQVPEMALDGHSIGGE